MSTDSFYSSLLLRFWSAAKHYAKFLPPALDILEEDGLSDVLVVFMVSLAVGYSSFGLLSIERFRVNDIYICFLNF